MSGPFEVGPVSAEEPPTRPPPDARAINPITGDYALDTDGEFLAMPVVRQRVVLALMTARRSMWQLDDFGNGFISIRKVGTSYEAQVKSSVRLALRQLVDVEKVVRIEDVKVERINTGRTQITVSYIDLTVNEPDTASVQV